MRTLYIYISKLIKNNLQNIRIRTKLLPYRKITKKKNIPRIKIDQSI